MGIFRRLFSGNDLDLYEEDMIYKPKKNKKKIYDDQDEPEEGEGRESDAAIESCYSLSEETLKTIQNNEIMGEIMWEDKNKFKNHPHLFALQYAGIIMLFSLSLMQTINGAPVRQLVVWFGVTLICALVFNTLSIPGMFLSFQNRIMVSILIALLLIGAGIPATAPYRSRFWVVVGIYSLLVLLLVLTWDKKWRYDERYKMDAATQSTIIGSAENMAVDVFKHHGLNECRTVALRHNLHFSEDILYGLFGDFWRCGYAYGYKKTEQSNADVLKASEAVAEMKEKYDSMAEELRQIKERNKALEGMQKDHEHEISIHRTHTWQAEKERDEAKKLSESVLRVNEELAHSLREEEGEEVAVAVEQSIQDRTDAEIIRMLKEEKTMDYIVNATGVAKSRVNKLRQQTFPEQYYTDENGKVRSKKGRNGVNLKDRKITILREASGF